MLSLGVSKSGLWKKLFWKLSFHNPTCSHITNPYQSYGWVFTFPGKKSAPWQSLNFTWQTLYTLSPGSSISNIPINTPVNNKIYPLSTVQSHLSICSHYFDIIMFQKLTECPTAAKDRHVGASNTEVWFLTAFFVSLAGKIWTAGSELLHHFLFLSL